LQEVESLRGELQVKDELIAAHIEKLGAWRQELSRLQAMQGVIAEVCVRRPRPGVVANIVQNVLKYRTRKNLGELFGTLWAEN
jgi:hypothetical protein